MTTIEEPRLRPHSLAHVHWRTVRRYLAAEAVVLIGLAAAGLLAITLRGPLSFDGDAGLDVTPELCVLMLAVGAGAALAATRLSVARRFCGAVAIAALTLVIISGVAATSFTAGPLGFTDGATLLYAALFVAHFAMGVWLIPDRLEGPEWTPAPQDESGQRGRSVGVHAH